MIPENYILYKIKSKNSGGKMCSLDQYSVLLQIFLNSSFYYLHSSIEQPRLPSADYSRQAQPFAQQVSPHPGSRRVRQGGRGRSVCWPSTSDREQIKSDDGQTTSLVHLSHVLTAWKLHHHWDCGRSRVRNFRLFCLLFYFL